MNHQQRKELVLESLLFSLQLLHKRSNASGANHRPGCSTTLYGCCMESVRVFLVFVFFFNQSRDNSHPRNATHEQSTSIQMSASSHPLQTCKSAAAGVQRQIQSLPALKCCCCWLTVGQRQSISRKPQVANLWTSDRNVCVCVCIPKCKRRQKFQSEAKHMNIPNSVTKVPCMFTKNDTRLWSNHGACRAWQWQRRASFKQWTSKGFKYRQQQNWWFTLIEIQWQMQGGEQPTSICNTRKNALTSKHIQQFRSNCDQGITRCETG